MGHGPADSISSWAPQAARLGAAAGLVAAASAAHGRRKTSTYTRWAPAAAPPSYLIKNRVWCHECAKTHGFLHIHGTKLNFLLRVGR